MSLGKTSKAYTQIQSSLTPLLEGIVVSIDPSIGSSSSQPGYAVYVRQVLRASGKAAINPTLPVHERLRQVAHWLRSIYKEWDPDVLVYEDIPCLRQGGGNAEAHASLLKAVGAILAVSGPDHCVGIMPLSWKKMIRSSYVKGDEADAREIGWIVIQEAARIQETDPPGRKYGERKAKAGKKVTPA